MKSFKEFIKSNPHVNEDELRVDGNSKSEVLLSDKVEKALKELNPDEVDEVGYVIYKDFFSEDPNSDEDGSDEEFKIDEVKEMISQLGPEMQPYVLDLIKFAKDAMDDNDEINKNGNLDDDSFNVNDYQGVDGIDPSSNLEDYEEIEVDDNVTDDQIKEIIKKLKGDDYHLFDYTICEDFSERITLDELEEKVKSLLSEMLEEGLDTIDCSILTNREYLGDLFESLSQDVKSVLLTEMKKVKLFKKKDYNRKRKINQTHSTKASYKVFKKQIGRLKAQHIMLKRAYKIKKAINGNRLKIANKLRAIADKSGHRKKIRL